MPENRKENEMKEKNEKTNDEVIMVTDDTGMQLYLSEKAANRLSWILTGLFALSVCLYSFWRSCACKRKEKKQ